MCDILHISSLIPSFELIHKFNNNHIFFKCKIIDLINGKFENWEYNRPPDYNRSFEIAKYSYNLNNKNSDLDWVLYTFYCNEDKVIKIFDGIHRYEALKIIYNENKKQIDLLDNNLFGSNGDAIWIYNKYIIISIRLNATNGEIIDAFQSLNKSNPVPSLYINNNDYEKKNIIEKVTEEWTTKFKTHFSTNLKPNIPNINKNTFIDILDIIYKKYKITKSNYNLLNELLYSMNDRIKLNPPKKASQLALKKCKESNCYLFLYKPDILEEMF